MSKLMLTMTATFAEFERDLILEGQREVIGEARKRNASALLRRKKAFKEAQVQEIRTRLAKSEKLGHLAKEYKIRQVT